MKVAVAIPTGEIGPYTIFYDSLINNGFPCQVQFIQCRGANIAENRNKLVESALESNCDYIWHVDSDQVFAPETLKKLLAHEVDVVSGLYVSRAPPFAPQMYDKEDEKGWVAPKLLTPDVRGTHEVKCVGAGCMLVHRRVYEKLEKPWWTLGQLEKSGWCDDVDWCRRVRLAGFTILCDTDIPVGHMISGALWPHWNGTDWETLLVYGNTGIASWPAAHLDEPCSY